MIRFKDGVETGGITKKCISAMSIISEYFTLYLDRDLIITSVCDGKHKTGSKHYEGNAFDLRTWTTDTSGIQLSVDEKHKLGVTFSELLGMDYDVVVEGTHIHIEYDKG